MRIPALTLLLCLTLPAFADDSFPTPDATAASAAPSGNLDEVNGGVPDLPSGTIYLMGRVQLAGTELDQAVFWQDRSVTTLDECNKVRDAGVTTGWTAFHPYLRTYRGMSYKVDYRCVTAQQRMSMFRYGFPFDSFYLVRSANNQLHLQPYNSFFACQNAMNARGLQISLDNFCASTSQHVVTKHDDQGYMN